MHLSCCRHGTSHGPNSHIQLQNQLLYPGSGSSSPARPRQIPFPSTGVWVLQAAGRDHGGGTVCSPCPSATAKGRAAENSTQGWLCCSAQLSLELGSPCLEVTYFIPCMPSCSIPRLRSGIAMQISPLLPQTVIIKSEVVKQAASIFGARPQQHMVIALS